MFKQKLYRLAQTITGITKKSLMILYSIVIKGLRIIQHSRLRRPLIISSGITGITVILVLSVTGLFNYKPDTLPDFPFIPPPAGENQKYYFEITTEALWDEYLSPYSDSVTAEVRYTGNSFIFKNILIDENKLKWRYDDYIVIDLIQFVPRDTWGLKKLKEGDVVDIIGICVGISDKNVYVIVGNCQFLPANLVPLPLPGGPAPIKPSY
jgi:hypothetical protein